MCHPRIRLYFALLLLGHVLAVVSWGQPSSNGVSVEGLSAPVAVRRDSRSIPYIEAANERDLYFVQGYITARDRLWQMDVLRRRARGQTAEIFGSAALEDDKLWRRYGFSRVADEGLVYLAPDVRQALDSYAAGVNAYISSLSPEKLPVEFQRLQYKPTPWLATDTIVVGKILSEALSSTWRQDLLRASISSLPEDKIKDLTNQVTPFDVVLFGTDKPAPAAPAATVSVPASAIDKAEALARVRERSLAAIGLFAEDLAASNNWVLAGKRTVDGKPILANDPHLAATAPGIWYMAHLSSPAMRVAGVTFPGVPGIVLGHNENFAWGATNVGPDVQDIYVETFDEQGRYKAPTGWQQGNTRREEIKVRKSFLKSDTDTVVLEVVETANGPIILEDGAKRYALKWTALDPKNSELGAFFGLNRGKDWEDFKRSLSTYGGATQNFVYADTKGNIGWYAAGRIPIRRTGVGDMPYDGSTNSGDWVGMIPFEDLPHLYNPPSGLIVTANQRIAGTTYKYQQISRDASLPWRARRIYDLLSSKPKLTMDDVRDVQLDVFNFPLSQLAKEIVASGAASPQTTTALKDWDGRMTADSKAALLVNEIRVCMSNKMAEANRPAPAAAVRERVLYWAVAEKSKRWLPPGLASYAELMGSCDTSSRALFADPSRFGPDESKWRWDGVYKARFMHPLAGVPFIGGPFIVEPKGVNGSGQTPNVGAYVSMRHISSPGNWDATRFVIPLGESGDPDSPHFRDQFESWRTGTPALLPFSKPAIVAAAPDVTVLKPLR